MSGENSSTNRGKDGSTAPRRASFRKRGLFIAGTDTGVGKTFVAAGLVRLARNQGLRAVAVKPVETGCPLRDGMLYPEDGVFLREASQDAISLDACVPFRFSLPASPARAAAMEGKHLSVPAIVEHVRTLAEEADLVVVEAAGGLMVPVQERLMMIDLAERLGYPTILVGRTRLGTINHTLLSVNLLTQREIPIAGIVLCRTEPASGPEELYTPADIARLVDGIPVVELPHLEPDTARDIDAIAEALHRSCLDEVVRGWVE